MIAYLLDTNICIYLMKNKPLAVAQKLLTCDISTVGVSAITVSELEYGVRKSARPEQNKLLLANFLASLEILPYTENVTGFYGEIRADLERRGLPVGSLDTLIAAHALSCDCVLVTNNEKEFRRINNLRVENWAKN